MRLLTLVTYAMVSLFVACANEDDSPLTATPTPSPGGTVSPATITRTGAVSDRPSPIPTGTIRYTSPTYGYSFEYPAGWFLSAPPVPSNPTGYAAVLTPWDPSVRQTALADFFKVDFVTSENANGLSLDAWFSDWVSRVDPGEESIQSTEATTVAGQPAWRQERILQSDGIHLTAIVFAKDRWIHQIIAYWAPGSKLVVSTLDPILQSFRLDP